MSEDDRTERPYRVNVRDTLLPVFHEYLNFQLSQLNPLELDGAAMEAELSRRMHDAGCFHSIS